MNMEAAFVPLERTAITRRETKEVTSSAEEKPLKLGQLSKRWLMLINK